MSRRTFVGLLAGASLGATLHLGARGGQVAAATGGRRVLPSACDHDCGGRCLMRVHVEDGRIVHIASEDRRAGEDFPLRSCTRGRAYRAHVYAADRILQPMRRIGARGEGRFAPISWDEALDTVASQMQRLAQKHGPATLFCGAGSGTASALNASFDLQMLLANFGGFTSGWSEPSWEGAHFAMEYTLGENDEDGVSKHADGFDAADFLDSRLILFWGWNPAHTHFGSGTKHYLQRAREAGIPIVCVDPVFTDSAAVWGGEWLPLRPGSDAAVLMAMAHVLFEEDRIDRAYVARHTRGADAYRAHLRGRNDGVVKDPRWASAISGLPAETIADLARRYAAARPAKLVAGYAPGRSAFGEQYHRAALALQALTGNIGRPGGGGAGHLVGKPPRFTTLVQTWWERFARDVEVHDASIGMIKTTHLADAILEGRRADPLRLGSHKPLPSDITLLYAAAWNPVNQLPNLNKTLSALRRLEFIVVQDQRLTPTARQADILLPACTMLEREDFTYAWRENEPLLAPQAQAIAPRGASRPDHWIFDALARRLGLAPLRGELSARDWLDRLLALDGHAPFAELVRNEGLREKRPAPWVAFRRNIASPEAHPFKTPSGRIEIESSTLKAMDFGRTSYGRPVPALPSHIEGAEGPTAADGRLPLQLVTTKSQYRCHSTFSGNPLLEELFVQAVWLNPRDAEARGVRDGQAVEVFNARGRIRLPARVTERILPGVVMIPEGAWYQPDANGTDRGGNPNLLTSDVASPGGAYAYNTARVEVAAA